MERKPVKVQLIKKEGTQYQIKFPNLKIPVTVNHNLYCKMLHSKDYQFSTDTSSVCKVNSA
jgi:hypothetical protein